MLKKLQKSKKIKKLVNEGGYRETVVSRGSRVLPQGKRARGREGIRKGPKTILDWNAGESLKRGQMNGSKLEKEGGGQEGGGGLHAGGTGGAGGGGGDGGERWGENLSFGVSLAGTGGTGGAVEKKTDRERATIKMVRGQRKASLDTGGAWSRTSTPHVQESADKFLDQRRILKGGGLPIMDWKERIPLY